MTQAQGNAAMQAAINAGSVSATSAFVHSWEGAANSMWGTTGQTGSFTYNEQGQHQIHAIDSDRDRTPDHFVNGIGQGQYFDPWDGHTGNVGGLTRQEGRETRGFDFRN